MPSHVEKVSQSRWLSGRRSQTRCVDRLRWCRDHHLLCGQLTKAALPLQKACFDDFFNGLPTFFRDLAGLLIHQGDVLGLAAA